MFCTPSNLLWDLICELPHLLWATTSPVSHHISCEPPIAPVLQYLNCVWLVPPPPPLVTHCLSIPSICQVKCFRWVTGSLFSSSPIARLSISPSFAKIAIETGYFLKKFLKKFLLCFVSCYILPHSVSWKSKRQEISMETLTQQIHSF